MKTFLAAILLMLQFVAVSPGWAVSFGPPGGIVHRTKYVSPPAAAIDDSGRVYVAWIEEGKAGNAVFVASSDDQGQTFSKEKKLNGPRDEPSSIHSSPAMAAGPNGEVYVAWTTPASEGAGFEADLMVSRSLDMGKNFGVPVRVNDNPEPVSVGFESLAVGPDGTVYAAWLDGRDKSPLGTSTRVAVSKDRAETFGTNVLIDTDSCPCCRTDVQASSDKEVLVTWRKVFPGNVREVVASTSNDGGVSFTKPTVVGADNWVIEGCPHRGPSIGKSGEGKVYVFWYSEAGDGPGIYLAEAPGPGDEGLSFAKTRITHTANTFPDNPVLEVSSGSVLLAWQETTPVFSRIIFEERGGNKPSRERLDAGPRRSTNPAISVNHKGDVLVAWQKHEIRTCRTVVRVGR